MFHALRKPTITRRSEDSFTLIELLIVVIIIGLLAAIALPIFLNQQRAAADARVQSDVRNTVDNVQTYLVANTGTAYANTGAWIAATPAGKPVITTGDTVGVNITSGGAYQVCGYTAAGNQYKTAAAAFIYDSTAGTFATGACVSDSDTGGTTSGTAQAGGTTGTITATLESGDATNGYWYNNDGSVRSSSYISTAQNHTSGGSQSMSIPSNNATDWQAYFRPTALLTVGKTYTVTAWVYINNPTTKSLTIEMDARGATTKTATTAIKGSWQQLSTTLTPTSSTGDLWFQIYGGADAGTTTSYVDDVTLVAQ